MNTPFKCILLYFNVQCSGSEEKIILSSLFKIIIDQSTIMFNDKIYSCMPTAGPQVPDPIRVQSCVCCLFWTNRNRMAVTSIFLYLIIQLEIWILNGNIYFYWNYSALSSIFFGVDFIKIYSLKLQLSSNQLPCRDCIDVVLWEPPFIE